MSQSPRDLLLLGMLTRLWGVNWPVMKIGVAELPPMALRSLSMIGGLPLPAAIVYGCGLTLRVPREHWRELFVLALINMVLWFVLAMYGVKLLSSGRSAASTRRSGRPGRTRPSTTSSSSRA